MRDLDVQHARHELNLLRGMLASIPADSKFGRRSLEARIARVEGQIAEATSTNAGRRGRVALRFDGPPVTAAQGIEPGFLGSAVDRYVDLVDAVHRDRVAPDKPSGHLIMTGHATGSFGVVLEEVGQERILGASDLALAIDDVSALLDAATTDLEAAASEVSSSVRGALHNFLSRVASRKARLKVDTDLSVIDLAPSQIETIVQQTAGIEERVVEESFVGTLQGVLRDRRAFEFAPDEGPTMHGKVDAGVDPARLGGYFNSRCRVTIRTITTKYPSGAVRTRRELAEVGPP